MSNCKVVFMISTAVILSTVMFVNAEQEKAAPTTQPYPLSVCVVSGEKLGGEMGEAKIINYDGTEVRFCCSDCIDSFNKNPQKYLKKIMDAKNAAK